MDIPKSFRPKNEDKIAGKTESLLKAPQTTSYLNLEVLVKYYEGFLSYDQHYREIEEKVEDIDYDSSTLQKFCDLLPKYEDYTRFCQTGTYLSALIYKIIKEDEEIELKLPDTTTKLDCIGHYFSKGKIIIEGDLGKFTGFEMSGGDIIVEGKIGYGTAEGMTGGRIFAEEIGSISKFYRSGEIYENGKMIRPKR